MAEKTSTLILKVDLDCCRCSKKINKVLCQLREPENIKTISYDEKNGTVTISGPFDPERLSKKLRCKACKVIKCIEIKQDPKPDPPKKVEKEKETEIKIEVEAESFCPPVPDRCDRPSSCYEGCNPGGCRCCSCARVYAREPVMTPPLTCYPSCYKYQYFFCEEYYSSPSCHLM